jgi:NADPH:quinone reductase-like Zn-dependent oxidoreductase
MIAVQFESLGLPQEVLEIKEIAKPSPQNGEVLIKVTACNINPSDVMFIRGLYGIRPELPSVAGFEAAGVVEAVGEGADFQMGAKVVFTNIGVWQEYVSVDARTVIPIPNDVPDEVACQLFVNPLTAYGMLETSGLKKGDFLILTAAASAFSKFVIQLCQEKGIKTIGTVRHDNQKEMLTKLGCDHVINTESESVTRTILSVTQGKGAQAAFDAVGGELGMKVASALRNGGTMFVYGLLSLQNIPLNSGILIFKDITIKGFWLTTWFAGLDGEKRKEAIKFLMERFLTGKLNAPVEKTYHLQDVLQAIEDFEKPGRAGKIILKTE